MEMKVRNLMKKSLEKMMKKVTIESDNDDFKEGIKIWKSGRLSVPVGCINRVVPNHSLLKILTLPKIDNFINFVFILRLS